MRVDRAREAGADALAACRRNGAWIDGALKQVLKRTGFPAATQPLPAASPTA